MSVYVGDVGTILELETGVTLTGAAFTKITVKKPVSGDTFDWVGSIKGDDDSVIEYTIIEGDLDEAGRYYVQSYVSLGTWIGHGERTSFLVKNPVDA